MRKIIFFMFLITAFSSIVSAEVIDSHPESYNNSILGVTAEEAGFGQAILFTNGSYNATSIAMFMDRGADDSFNIRGYLWAVNDTGIKSTIGTDAAPNGTLLATTEIKPASVLLDGTFKLVTLNFSSEYVLTNNTKYAFSIVQINRNSGDILNFGVDYPTPVHDGNAFRRTSSTAVYDVYSNRDMIFYFNGTTTSSGETPSITQNVTYLNLNQFGGNKVATIDVEIVGTWSEAFLEFNETNINSTYECKNETGASFGNFTALADSQTANFTIRTVSDTYDIYERGATPPISNLTNTTNSSTSQDISWNTNQTTNNYVQYNTTDTCTVFYTSGTFTVDHPASYSYDNDWNTYAESTGALSTVVHECDIPAGAQRLLSKFHVKDYDGETNLTIPEDCWNGTTLLLKLSLKDTGNYAWWAFNDTETWVLLRGNTSDNVIYEGEVIFGFQSEYDNATASPGITLTGLTPSTFYNAKAISEHQYDPTANTSEVFSFTTNASSGSTITALANQWTFYSNATGNITYEDFCNAEENITSSMMWNEINQRWDSYYPTWNWNKDAVIPSYRAVMAYFEYETTITTETVTPSYYPFIEGYNMGAVQGSSNTTLGDMNTSIGANCTAIYAWDGSDWITDSATVLTPNIGWFAEVNSTWNKTGRII
jgi:hypothetical protein